MLNVALFGPPGAGKGTQSARLLQRYGLHYIATGDLLRNELKNQTELGLQAKAIIEQGGLVPDEIIVQILEKTITSHTNVNGFLFDGFPRTFVQAYILEGLLRKLHTSLANLISLEVPREECYRRLINRAKTSGRSDDTKAVIEFRLKEYEEKTAPVLSFYDERKIRVPVDGTGTEDEVFGRISAVLDESLMQVQLNVVMLGAPGAGRGTQAKRLAERFNLSYLSTGDLLLKEIELKTETGRLAETYLQAGKLVPDEIVIRLIEGHIESNANKNGFIFKGFPRTLVQAYILDGLLRKIGSKVSCILDIQVPPLELVKRLAQRGFPFDNSAEAIVRRIEEHEKYAKAIVDYYSKTGRLHSVDGTGSKEAIYERLAAHVEDAWRKAR